MGDSVATHVDHASPQRNNQKDGRGCNVFLCRVRSVGAGHLTVVK